MTEFEKVAAPPPDIATRAELLQRQKQRATPSPQLTLTPHDSRMSLIKSQSASMVESRIDFLKQSLDRAHQKIERDHTKARLSGHARADFERSR